MHNSIDIDIYNEKIQYIPIIPCFSCEKLCFQKQLKCFSNQLSKQFFIYFLIQIKSSSTSYICINVLHNISENKPPLYQILNIYFKNKIILSIQKLTQ